MKLKIFVTLLFFWSSGCPKVTYNSLTHTKQNKIIMTPREEVKKNLERCIELVGGDNELSRLTGISVGRIRNWIAMKTDIPYSDYIHIIDTSAQHERERVERINNIDVEL